MIPNDMDIPKVPIRNKINKSIPNNCLDCKYSYYTPAYGRYGGTSHWIFCRKLDNFSKMIKDEYDHSSRIKPPVFCPRREKY